MSSLVKGTLILTLATAISKILGFLYVVPFTALVGIQGYILFEYAYKPYALMLSLATLGVPLAVSKYVSKYNALGDYRSGQQLFRSGVLLLALIGIICFLLLFSFAPQLAGILISENDQTGNTAADVVYVIRMVSFALLIVPPMAVARGFFQGYGDMRPTAFSQVIEQLVRISFILIGAFLAIYIWDASTTFAAGIATFGAFIGALGGIVVLYHYLKKYRSTLQHDAGRSVESGRLDRKEMFQELLTYAVPFALVGLIIPIFQTADTFMINQAIMKTGATQLEAETVNSVVALVQKVIFIPVSLATALALNLVPQVTKAFETRNDVQLKQLISQTFSMTFFVTIPAVVLLMALSAPTFSFLFGKEQEVLGGSMLFWHAPSAILFSVSTVVVAILQEINRYQFVVGTLFAGLAFKLLTNTFFVHHFGGAEALATNLGFLLAIIWNLYALRKERVFALSTVILPTAKILGLAAVTGILVWGIDAATHARIGNLLSSNFLYQAVRLALCGTFGVLFYAVVSYRTGMMEDAMGKAFLEHLMNKTKPAK